jgi:uncharacterized membrane protein
MSLFLDIGQGAGVSGATGVRPFLPTLLVGALASNDAGIDFDATDYSFLESPWFLFVIVLLAAAVYAANGRFESAPLEPEKARRRADALERGSAVVGIVLGGLLFAGSLAADGRTSWWGLPAGIACAALAYFAAWTLFSRARRRLAGQSEARVARSLIDIYAEGVGLALAALSVLVEPAGYAALLVFLFLLVRSRGGGAQKYGGLRILR